MCVCVLCFLIFFLFALCYVILRCILLLLLFFKTTLFDRMVVFYVVHNLSSCRTFFFCFPCCCFFPAIFSMILIFLPNWARPVRRFPKYYENTENLAGLSREKYAGGSQAIIIIAKRNERTDFSLHLFSFVRTKAIILFQIWANTVIMAGFGKVASAKKKAYKIKTKETETFYSFLSRSSLVCVTRTTTVWYRSTVFGVYALTLRLLTVLIMLNAKATNLLLIFIRFVVLVLTNVRYFLILVCLLFHSFIMCLSVLVTA